MARIEPGSRARRDVSGPTRLRSRAGFTITELLVSVVIISVGVVGFVSAVGLASTELWFGRRDSEISMLVTDQLEQIKAMGHDALQSGERLEGPYRLAWSVAGSNPKKVMLVVEYPRSDGSTQGDTLITYVPR
jgi:prepilin-type N-terminal cleavage/methylation domain-containing protein